MFYGQKNYNEMLGGGNGGGAARYTIRQCGCLLTLFSNVLEKCGVSVDPLALNRQFIDQHVFIDVDDGVKDDLGWQSITAYDGQIVVKSIGTGPFPTNEALIGLKLSDPGVVGGLHFVLFDHMVGDEVYILDSWDGQVKSQHTYGPILQWCVFGNNKPQAVSVYVPQVVPDTTGEELLLPPANSWAIYRLGTAGRKGTSDQVGSLAPYKFTNDYGEPGLNYDVLGHPMANFVTIKTRDYGVVNIYIGSGTGAILRQKPQSETPQPATPTPVSITTPAPEAVAEAPTPDTAPEVLASETVQPENTISGYDTSVAGRYKSNRLTTVNDLVGTMPSLIMPFKIGVTVAGKFAFNGKEYYRTKKSALPENDWWYGIPVETLDLVELDNPPKQEEDDDSIFNLDIAEEAREFLGNLSTREKIVAFIAKIYNFFSKLKTNKK